MLPLEFSTHRCTLNPNHTTLNKSHSSEWTFWTPRLHPLSNTLPSPSCWSDVLIEKRQHLFCQKEANIYLPPLIEKMIGTHSPLKRKRTESVPQLNPKLISPGIISVFLRDGITQFGQCCSWWRNTNQQFAVENQSWFTCCLTWANTHFWSFWVKLNWMCRFCPVAPLDFQIHSVTC